MSGLRKELKAIPANALERDEIAVKRSEVATKLSEKNAMIADLQKRGSAAFKGRKFEEAKILYQQVKDLCTSSGHRMEFKKRVEQCIEGAIRLEAQNQFPEDYLDVYILLDNSGSMTVDSKLDVARRYMKALVRIDLTVKDFMSLAAFNQDINESSQTPPDGFTHLYDAILHAALSFSSAQGQGEERKRVIVCLTDGEDTGSTITIPDLATCLREEQATLYLIAVGDQSEEVKGAMNELCTESNGHFITADESASYLSEEEQITRVTEKVWKELREDRRVLQEPEWSNLPVEEALCFSMTMPESIESILEVFDLSLNKAIADFPDRDRVRIKLSPHAFPIRTMRAAFYAKPLSGAATIVKESMYINKNYLKARYESTLQCHRVTKFLTFEFNRVKSASCSTINFCNACIIQLMARPDQPYMTMEDRIPGEFEKYNNNSGYAAPSPTKLGTLHEAVQAFSHWTHCVTLKHMIVVDCQGSYDSKTKGFLLTDPAIHCKDWSRFGDTNTVLIASSIPTNVSTAAKRWVYWCQRWKINWVLLWAGNIVTTETTNTEIVGYIKL